MPAVTKPFAERKATLEAVDGFGGFGEAEDFAGDVGLQAELAEVEEGVEDGGEEMFWVVGGAGGLGGVGVGVADHLAHSEAAAGEEERGERGVMVAAAVFVEL